MQSLMKNGAFSAVHVKEFARIIVLFKRENRKFGIKDGIAIPEKHTSSGGAAAGLIEAFIHSGGYVAACPF